MAMAGIASHLNQHARRRQLVSLGEITGQEGLVPMLSAAVRGVDLDRPPLPSMTDRAAEFLEWMFLEVRKVWMWSKWLWEIHTEHGAPFVTQVTGDTAVDHAELRDPELANSFLEVPRGLYLATLLEDLLEALLDGYPVALGLTPKGERDQGKEEQRQHHQPSEIMRPKSIFVFLCHVTVPAASRAMAYRANRGANTVHAHRRQ